MPSAIDGASPRQPGFESESNGWDARLDRDQALIVRWDIQEAVAQDLNQMVW